MDYKLPSDTEKHLIRALINALQERPRDWAFDEFRATDRKTNVAIWIGNRRFGLRLKQPIQTEFFRPLNKWRLWRALRPFVKSHNRQQQMLVEAAIRDLERCQS